MTHYRKPLSVVSIVAGLALVVAGFVATPVSAAESSGSITYSCEVFLFGTAPLGAIDSPVTATLKGPDSVQPGASFDVSVDIAPGINNGPVAVTPANQAIATQDLGVTGGTPSSVGATSTELVLGPANGVLTIPTLTASVTAGDSGSVTLSAAQLRIQFSGGTFVQCDVKSGSASIQVPITSGTTDPDATTTTLDPDSTTTTAAPTTAAPTTAAPTTAAPTTAAPTTAVPTVAGPAQSQTVTKSAQVSYSCQALLSGAPAGPPTVDLQTVTFKGVDKVNSGQSFPVTVSVSPGVTNGPVPQGAGEIVPSIEVSVDGGSPSPLRMTGAANTGDVAAGGTIPIAPMSASVRATASAGGTVDFKPGVITLAIDRFDASVVCTPASRPTVLSVNVVATPVVVAGSSTTAASSSSSTTASSSTLATTGLANAGALSLIGLGMILGGAAVLRMGRTRHDDA
jgi:hypothetical protein